MATVKGDVHDIGKNIVGVVLQCNNYEVIDLGVMVPARRSCKRGARGIVDMIGLSGLITPSLDEMVHVAKRDAAPGLRHAAADRRRHHLEAHTAVKIAGYENDAVVYVPDASRSVSVAGQLLGDRKADYVAGVTREYDTVRERFAGRRPKSQRLEYAAALANRAQPDWSVYEPPRPTFTGVRVIEDIDLAELLPTIDWTPFFMAWELAGKFPAILEDEVVGVQARDLYADAQEMLSRIVDERWLEPRAVLGFWPARSNGEDIELLENQDVLATLHHLRQQIDKPNDEPNYSLSDFVAPEHDYLGAFCVSTGHGVDERAAAYEAAGDDYNAILLKALADRLAESLAEYLHRRVRREFWAYAPDETLDNDALIRERYRGIRPAPGYPACPDHSEKSTLFTLLAAPANIGVSLTDSYAMLPASSVSGWYFAHPDARYFKVGKIGEDQLESLARRKGESVATLRRGLAPNLD
jgi:5-methyltetrahydrofolate--homocysteine methyltransferase